ncbi:hypothetical protein [Iodobacter fluviatilis]|uniref:Uncharacterized protein n=1 Tax=Iodobacter fluviatilis TaxID=537 RepID=A0A377Q7Z0_9NEIS|nr:hypothetical protein [Iodobacter fluviatilis]TCU89309.1 hypothetical protein EV682_102221 [Iodobacter fluviatilis]STQ90679.1 Uncharacterised protein [Iodobacter fluviatilis]
MTFFIVASSMIIFSCFILLIYMVKVELNYRKFIKKNNEKILFCSIENEGLPQNNYDALACDRLYFAAGVRENQDDDYVKRPEQSVSEEDEIKIADTSYCDKWREISLIEFKELKKFDK